MTENYQTERERFSAGDACIESAVPFASASCLEFRAAYPALLLL
jgi:hypothetical protein